MYQRIVSLKKFGGEWMEIPRAGAGAYGRQVPNLLLGQGAGFSWHSCGFLKMGCGSIMRDLCCVGL